MTIKTADQLLDTFRAGQPKGAISSAATRDLIDSSYAWGHTYKFKSFGGKANDSFLNDSAFADLTAKMIADGNLGGIVEFDSGIYRFDAQISPHRLASFRGQGKGRTIISFAAATGAFPNFACIYQQGDQYLAIGALSIAPSKYNQKLTFGAAPNVVAGDWILLYNTIDFSFNASRPYYRDGEFCKVVGVVGNVVYLKNPLFSTYPIGVSVYKIVNPARCMYNGLTVIGNGETLKGTLRIERALKPLFIDLDGGNSNQAILEFYQCIAGEIIDCSPEDYTTPGGTNYALVIANSQHVKVRGGQYMSSRHGITYGGTDVVGSIPNRDVFTYGATIECNGLAVGTNGANIHGNAEYCGYLDCTLPQGVSFGGDFITIKGCPMKTPWNDVAQTESVAAILCSEPVGADMDISDCPIEVTANIAGPTSSAIALGVNNYFENMTRSGGVVKVANIHIKFNGFNGDGVVVKNTAGTTQEISARVLNITSDRDTVPPIAFTPSLVSVTAAAGKDFKEVTVGDGVLRGRGIRVTGLPERLTVKKYTALDCLLSALFVESNDDGVTPLRYPNGQLYYVEGIRAEASRNSGVVVGGLQTTTTLIIDDIVSISNGQNIAGGSNARASAFFQNLKELIIRGEPVMGDSQAVQTQARGYSTLNISKITEPRYMRWLGAGLVNNRVNVLNPTNWGTDKGNTNPIINKVTDAEVVNFETALTVTRNCTIIDTGAWIGAQFLIRRTGLGAGNLTITVPTTGIIATIPTGTAAGGWVLVERMETLWKVRAQGLY